MNRDDAKIMQLEKLREKCRCLYVTTGDKEYCEGMATIDQLIEIEMNKEARLLSKVLLGMLVAIPIAIVVMWRLSSGT